MMFGIGQPNSKGEWDEMLSAAGGMWGWRGIRSDVQYHSCFHLLPKSIYIFSIQHRPIERFGGNAREQYYKFISFQVEWRFNKFLNCSLSGFFSTFSGFKNSEIIKGNSNHFNCLFWQYVPRSQVYIRMQVIQNRIGENLLYSEC